MNEKKILIESIGILEMAKYKGEGHQTRIPQSAIRLSQGKRLRGAYDESKTKGLSFHNLGDLSTEEKEEVTSLIRGIKKVRNQVKKYFSEYKNFAMEKELLNTRKSGLLKKKLNLTSQVRELENMMKKEFPHSQKENFMDVDILRAENEELSNNINILSHSLTDMRNTEISLRNTFKELLLEVKKMEENQQIHLSQSHTNKDNQEMEVVALELLHIVNTLGAPMDEKKRHVHQEKHITVRSVMCQTPDELELGFQDRLSKLKHREICLTLLAELVGRKVRIQKLIASRKYRSFTPRMTR